MYPEFIAIYIGLGIIVLMLVAVIVLLAFLLKKVDRTILPNRNATVLSERSSTRCVAICKNCGTRFDGASKVCPKCGTAKS